MGLYINTKFNCTVLCKNGNRLSTAEREGGGKEWEIKQDTAEISSIVLK